MWFQCDINHYLRSVVLAVWFSGSTESQSPRNLQEMQIFMASPDLVNDKLWRWGPETCVLTNISGFWCILKFENRWLSEIEQIQGCLTFIIISCMYEISRFRVLLPVCVSNNLFFSFKSFTLICIPMCWCICLCGGYSSVSPSKFSEGSNQDCFIHHHITTF